MPTPIRPGKTFGELVVDSAREQIAELTSDPTTRVVALYLAILPGNARSISEVVESAIAYMKGEPITIQRKTIRGPNNTNGGGRQTIL